MNFRIEGKIPHPFQLPPLVFFKGNRDKSDSMKPLLAIIFISVGLALPDFDEIEDIRANTSSSKMRLKAIRECPLLVSSMLPFDYKEMFNEKLPIDLLFTMYRFVDIDDLQESISFVGALDLIVHIFNCGYENGTKIFYTVNHSNQWYPIIYHHTSKEHFDLSKNFLLPISILSKSNVHKIRYNYYGKLEAICSGFSFTKFPFDQQTCGIIFYSAEITENFQLLNRGIGFDKDFFATESDIWQFENVTMEINPVDDIDYTVWRIKVMIDFQRKYQYYIGNIFIPAFGLYLIQFAALLLPPENSDRPTFSVTVVLAYTLVLTSVFSLIPRTTEPVYLVILLEIKLISSIFLTCYMLFACFCINKNEQTMKETKIMFRKMDIVIAISSFLAVFASDVILLTLMNQ